MERLADKPAEDRTVLEQAIIDAGGIVRMARHLGVTRNAIHQWKLCPPERVLEVEALSGIHCTRLRPDLYPPDRFGSA